MSQNYITKEGLEKLKEELKFLQRTKRKEISERLQKCLAFGDLTENAEYHETKEEQDFMEGRVLELEEAIRNAVTVSGEKNKDWVQVGSTILVSLGSQKEKFKIVGAEEAHPLEGKISANSPLGKAALNKRSGEVVLVQTPQGKLEYKILKIE